MSGFAGLNQTYTITHKAEYPQPDITTNIEFQTAEAGAWFYNVS